MAENLIKTCGKRSAYFRWVQFIDPKTNEREFRGACKCTHDHALDPDEPGETHYVLMSGGQVLADSLGKDEIEDALLASGEHCLKRGMEIEKEANFSELLTLDRFEKKPRPVNAPTRDAKWRFDI